MLAPCTFRTKHLRHWCLYALTIWQFASGDVAFSQEARISNLSDLALPLWVTGDPGITQDIFICAYASSQITNNRTYSITAIGDGPGFLLKSGINTIAYTLEWSDGGTGNPAGGETKPLLNNITLPARNNARNDRDLPRNSSDCNAGSNPTARLRISISQTAMDAARDGVFSGTLSIIMSVN